MLSWLISPCRQGQGPEELICGLCDWTMPLSSQPTKNQPRDCENGLPLWNVRPRHHKFNILLQYIFLVFLYLQITMISISLFGLFTKGHINVILCVPFFLFKSSLSCYLETLLCNPQTQTIHADSWVVSTHASMPTRECSFSFEAPTWSSTHWLKNSLRIFS